MDHDRLFKELLTSFFLEFLDLFVEDIAALIDRTQSPIFLDKETFGELTSDKRRELDLVARVKLITGDAHFLVYMEPQAQWLDNFPEKMFSYFCRLWERHRIRVYPIAILSFRDHPEVQESELAMRFPGLNVLNFRFAIVQLNRLDWKAFIDKPNPVASALMARMKFTPEERPKVKVECLRLLATLRLQPAKSALISRFVDSYLRLTTEEVRRFDEILETIPEVEKQEIMQIKTSWEEIGEQRGEQRGELKGLRNGLASGLRLNFGERAQNLIARLADCDLEALQQLERRLVPGVRLEDLEA